MKSAIHMLNPNKIAKEGETPQPYADPKPLGKEHPVLVGASWMKENTRKLPYKCDMEDLLDACGIDEAQVKAVFLGWPQGKFLRCEEETELELNCETLFLVGKEACIVDVLAGLSSELRNGCCGRCVFGREGTYQLNLFFADIAAKKGRSTDLERLTELCEVMQTQTRCSFGTACASAILSAISLFADEMAAHIGKKICPQNVCKAYLSYYIDPARCNGCRECAEACDEEAIEGRKGFIHILDREMCEKCDDCIEACDRGAIKAASGLLPRLPVKPIPCGSWK